MTEIWKTPILLTCSAVLAVASLCAPSASAAPRLMDHSRLESVPGGDAETLELNTLLTGASPATAAKVLRRYRTKYAAAGPAQPAKSRTLDFSITLPGATLANKKGLESALLSAPSRKTMLRSGSANPSEGQMAVVQFERELGIEDKIAFFDTGAVFYRQIAPSAVAAFLSPEAARKLAELSFVRWLGPYLDEYKYSASDTAVASGKAEVYAFGPLHDSYKEDLASLGITITDTNAFLSAYEVVLPRNAFANVAALSWVRLISTVKNAAVHSAVFWPEDSRKMVGGPAMNSGQLGTAFTGSGVTIGVYDTGVSITNSYDLPTSMFDTRSNLGDDQGHGTHVSGIIAARGNRIIDSSHTATGMAPEARIYMVRGIGEGSSYSTYLQAFAKFQAAGIQIANHSWGWENEDKTSRYDYDDGTETIDTYSSSTEYPMLNIISAGNDGLTGLNTINNPGTAKNVITVGAVQYVEDPDQTGLLIGTRALYSSRGPTATSVRLKPELVAPGGMTNPTTQLNEYGVVSVNYNLAASTDSWPSDQYYTRMSGTSMAAPHVTGAAAYLLQLKKSFSGYTEWAKAWLINSAQPLAANSGALARTGYANTDVGYGLLEPINMMYDVPGESEKITEHVSILTQGKNEAETWDVPVPAGTKRLAITMAYNDYPGQNIMNNLDLTLSNPDGSDWGGFSTTGDGFYWGGLPTNVTGESPVEKIIVDNPTAGNWKVKIYAKAWPTSPLVPTVRYAFVAKVYYTQPVLALSGRSHYYAKPSQSVAIGQTITNTGGGVAAGVTLKPSSSDGFSGSIGQVSYVGNLSSATVLASSTFTLTAPAATGTKTVRFYGNAINLGTAQVYRDVTVEVVNDNTPPVGTVVINGGALYAKTPALELALAATDATGVESMRFSENGTDWTDWMDYATSATFTISSVSGSHTVYAQFKDGVGNVSTPLSISSAITLDLTIPRVTLTINSGGAHTNTAAVTLNVTTVNGGSPVTNIRIANDSASNLGSYVSTATAYPWTLSSGDGVKSVYVQVQAASELESEVAYSSITLISGPPTLTVSIDKDPAPQGQRTITLQSPAQLQTAPVVTVIQNGQTASTPVTMLPVTTLVWTWQGFYNVLPGYEGTANIHAASVDLATNTISQNTAFVVDTTSPTAKLTYLTARPAKSGALALRFEGVDATTITVLSLAYTIASSTLSYNIALTSVSSATWNGTGFVDSYLSSGTAVFAAVMRDAAGNVGTVLTGDTAFSVDTRLSGATGGIYAISDGTFVNMPAGTYSGDLFVPITVPNAARADVLSKKTINFYSDVISEVNLNREFSASDAATGAAVNTFTTPITIAIPYPDADNNDVIDGTHVKVSNVKLFLYTTHGWQMLTNTVTDTVNKLFKAEVNHFSLYAARSFSSAATFDDARAYPNPCKMKQYALTIDHLPLAATEPVIKIYNLAGELVRTLTTADGIGAYNIGTWDGRNSSGEKVSTGTYILLLTAKNMATNTIKAAIIW